LLESGQLSAVLKDDVQYEIRRTVDDIEKRLGRARARKNRSQRTKGLVLTGEGVLRRGRRLLRRLASGAEYYDIGQKLKLTAEAMAVYRVVVACLRDEFAGDAARLERLITKIDSVLLRHPTQKR
jgi:hypothetical protein